MSNHKRREPINWLAIRTAFVVNGWSSQRVSQEFGVDPTTVRKRAAKEGWTTERRRLKKDASETVFGEAREQVVAAIAGELAAHAQAADAIVQLTMSAHEKLSQAIDNLAPSEVGKLRSLIEATAKLADATAKGVQTSRLVRGLRDGDVSDKANEAEKATTIGIDISAIPVPELTPLEDAV